MLEIEIYKVVKSPVIMSKIEWKYIIHTGRDYKVWIRKEMLSTSWKKYSQIRI